MKDIDFDELDRAVNSLMSSVDQPQDDKTAPAPQSAVSVSSPATSVAVTPAPVAEAQSPVAQVVASSPAPAPAQAVPVRPAAPAVRRSGRFMDMVSTSAAKPATPAPSAPSREGLSITPRPASTTDAAPTAPEPTPTPAPLATDVTMPDPLDMVAPTPAQEPETVDTPETVASSSAEELSAPLESPFLADAKVEKRPLNPGTPLDSTPEVPQLLTETQPADTIVPQTDAPSGDADLENSKKGEDEPPVLPQVPELDSDLVAIESSEQVEATQATETADAVNQVDSPAIPLGASSIAQQYKTTPSTGDQNHAAIYDASQYPQPVAHPAKHRSSWWWVLWVILLLGVGAGGAVLLYNLKIIP